MKSLNYLNNVMARIEANLAGADEALMLNDAGNVAECTADNVFVIKRGADLHSADHGGGVARNHALSRVRYRGGTRDQDFRDRDHAGTMCSSRMNAFLTGTAAEVIPVIKADGRVIGTGKPGPITRADDRPVPRDDARNRHADLFLNDAGCDSARKVLKQSWRC